MRKRYRATVSTAAVLLLLCGSLSAATVRYQYDALNRLTRADYPNGTSVAYTYDPAGNILQEAVTVGSCPVGQDVVEIQGVVYPDKAVIVCVAGVSISAGPAVTVATGADVIYRAPSIALGSGFQVEASGKFQAGFPVLGKTLAKPSAEPNRTHQTYTWGDGGRESAGSSWAAQSRGVYALPAALRALLAEAGAGISDLSTDADGRYFLFVTDSGLVSEDRNGFPDVYLYDGSNEVVSLVSARAQGVAGNGPSLRPRMDEGGERVVFESGASNLVPHDTNETSDIFLWSRASWSVERVSWSPEGWESGTGSTHPALDAAGEQILYDRIDEDGYRQIYGYDRDAFLTEPLSETENAVGERLDNHHPAISRDGRYIAYREDTFSRPASATCAVHFYDQWDGAYTRVPCPQELAGGEYIPYFTADATAIGWVEEGGPDNLIYAPALRQVVVLENPLGGL